MEMNTRLQVEHCVTEMRTGLDLVKEQIRVAAGHPLSFSQEDVTLTGCAMELRLNAEDAERGFAPTPGLIERWELPKTGDGLRIDTHVVPGYRVPPHYDSLLCKLIAHAPTRQETIQRLLTALDALVCEGVPTTAPLFKKVLQSARFQSGDYDTRSIPGWED